jgi:hypothetical protein
VELDEVPVRLGGGDRIHLGGGAIERLDSRRLSLRPLTITLLRHGFATAHELAYILKPRVRPLQRGVVWIRWKPSYYRTTCWIVGNYPPLLPIDEAKRGIQPMPCPGRWDWWEDDKEYKKRYRWPSYVRADTMMPPNER